MPYRMQILDIFQKLSLDPQSQNRQTRWLSRVYTLLYVMTDLNYEL